MSSPGKPATQALLPLLMGVLAFFLVIGPRALDPQNIAWLGSGDPATHYLGWVFFRHSPWTFPLGLNPSYGLELSSAIIFSDSNPLLALLFKPFDAWLPPTFQYFGLWLLICFVLQAWFGWKLLGLMTPHPVLRLLGVSGLLLFSPSMFLRMGGHLSLAGHFLLLAALYLALQPALHRRKLAWGALLAVTALVHAYLLAMVALIWVANVFGKRLDRSLTKRQVWIELAALFSLVTFCCWQAGYFSIADGAASGGFGLYRMNLLSPFDPAGWSFVLPSLPKAAGDYEGFNYLGLGVLMLIPMALTGWFANKSALKISLRKRPLLLWALLALCLFALSNNIGFGTFTLHYPLPKFAYSLANIFRASGRMFWPVLYALIVLMLFYVVRGYRPRLAMGLLGLALVVQIVDTRSGWNGLRESRMIAPASHWASPMQDPFWASAAAHYANIRSLMPQNQGERWQMSAEFTARYGLKTDSVYLGRTSSSAQEAAQKKARRMLETGQYDADSLYILDDAAVAVAAHSIHSDTDVLTRVDGVAVLAPGWKRCTECLPVLDEGRLISRTPLIHIGETQTFNYQTRQLVDGWGSPESWGTWTVARHAIITLRLPPEAQRIEIDAMAFVLPQHPVQRVIVNIDGSLVVSAQLTQLQGNHFEIPLDARHRQKLAEHGQLTIELQMPDAISPQALGLNDDQRVMGLGLKSLTVY